MTKKACAGAIPGVSYLLWSRMCRGLEDRKANCHDYQERNTVLHYATGSSCDYRKAIALLIWSQGKHHCLQPILALIQPTHQIATSKLRINPTFSCIVVYFNNQPSETEALLNCQQAPYAAQRDLCPGWSITAKQAINDKNSKYTCIKFTTTCLNGVLPNGAWLENPATNTLEAATKKLIGFIFPCRGRDISWPKQVDSAPYL